MVTCGSKAAARRTAEPGAGRGPGRRNWRRWAIIVGAGLIPLGYGLSIDDVLGGWGDDAWYLVLGKALATGQGFRAISLPAPPAVPLYPPGFPALLAVAWTACPSASLNAVCFKLVPILLALGFSVLSYLVLRAAYGAHGGLVAAAVVAAGLQPYLTSYLGSTVMSDMPYAFLSMAVILLVEGYARGPGATGWRLAASVLLLAGLYLTRYVGISLILASGAYLLMRREPRKALCLWAATAVLLVPWLSFSLTESGPADLMEPKGMRMYADNLSWLASLGVWGYLQFLVQNLVDLFRVNLPTVVLPVSAWVLTQRPGWEGNALLVGGLEAVGVAVAAAVVLGYLVAVRSRLRSGGPGLLELYVFFYMLVVLSQPVHSPRYLLPLAPVMTYYLFWALRRLAAGVARLGGCEPARIPALVRPIGVALILVLGGSHLLVNAVRVYTLHWRPGSYYDRWPETVEAYRWIRSHTAPEVLVASPNPAQAYLYAERRAIYPLPSREELRARRVEYVLDSVSSLPGRSGDDPPQRVFISAGGRVSVFRVAGP